MRHPSTPAERGIWISELVAKRGEYGAVTALSRQTGVPRQTLTTWRDQGQHALESWLTSSPKPAPTAHTEVLLARAVLTLLVCGHASYRGIQACVDELWGKHISLGTIQGIVAEAGRRAQRGLDRLVPSHCAGLALDELFNGNARAAYLSAVDARDGVVWATAGPVPADADSWTVVLWEVQERGGRWPLTLHDGGHAAAAGAAVVDPTAGCARDLWHVVARWGQTQHRLDVRVTEAQTKWVMRERYEARVATGGAGLGKPPSTSAATQAGVVAQEHAWAEAMRVLGHEVRTALDVVVRVGERVLDPVGRRQELETALALLAELAATMPLPLRTDLDRVHAHTTQALTGLLVCADRLAPLETALTEVAGAAGVGLVAWAWQRQTALALDDDGIVAGLPPDWQDAARGVVAAWSRAVRTTSLAESWHALLRAHVAVHRGLTPGVLALLAVWHNHRVVPRGKHAGTSSLHRSGLSDAPTDWLTALGYPPTSAASDLVAFPARSPLVQEVAA
jgi:hypothetical protein